MSDPKSKKIVTLLADLARYTIPHGNWRVRGRITAAFACLMAAKGSNIITPLMYGAAVDLVNGEQGFAMSALMWVVAGYALARLGLAAVDAGDDARDGRGRVDLAPSARVRRLLPPVGREDDSQQHDDEKGISGSDARVDAPQVPPPELHA